MRSVKNRVLLTICAFFFPTLITYAQQYQVITFLGMVEVMSPGETVRHSLMPDEVLFPQSHLFIDKGGYVTLNEIGNESFFFSIGTCSGEMVGDMIKRSPKKFWKRIVAIAKGVGDMTSEQFNAAIKGDDQAQELLYALHNTSSYRPSLDVSLEVTCNGKRLRGKIHDGDVVSFKLFNREPNPVFVSVLWKGTSGVLTDCLTQSRPFFLIPPLSNIDLSGDTEVVAGPPFGVESIYLLASEEFFNPLEIITEYERGSLGETVGAAIGFSETLVQIAL